MVEGLPVLLIASTMLLLIIAGVGWAINAFPFVGVIIAVIVAVVLMAVFLSMVPSEPPASDPANVHTFLEDMETKYGNALFLFTLLDVSLGKVATLAERGSLAIEWRILIAIVFAMATFMVDGIAIGLDGKDGAFLVGLLALSLSGLTILLLAKSLAELITKGLGRPPGQTIAYGLFTGGMFIAALASFLADTGYVLKNHN